MQLVENVTALDQTIEKLTGEPQIYLDTEFESSKQGSRLCLVQLSAGDEVYLIDPFRLRDLKPLRAVLARDDCEWVFHAGAQDVQLLLEHLELDAPPRLFDTQVAWALVGPEYSVSLVYLLYRVLGIRAQKTHQADDWKRRPLPRTQLEYAAADVEHLPAIRRILLQRAEELGRAGVIGVATRELIWPPNDPPQKLHLTSFRNAWQLDARSQAAFCYLIDWYNGLGDAERAAAPEAKVLLSIANRMPASAEDLERIKGVSRHFARRQGSALTAGLIRASEAADTADFVPIDPPPYATFEELRVDGWLGMVRAESCLRAQISPELALPSRLLKRWRVDVLRERSERPVREGLQGWRREVLGTHLAAACERFPLELPPG